MAFNIFKHDRIRATEILQDTINFVVDKFKQSKKVFTVSSVYGQILYVLENLSNFIFYYIEDSTTEFSIREASRASSIYSIASLAGYNPSRSIAASGQICLKRKQTIDVDIAGDIISIPNYLKIMCKNTNKDYILDLGMDDMRIDTTSTEPIYINILQGKMETQQLASGTGRPYASYSMPFKKNFFVDNKMVKVYVNDELQPAYDNLLKIPQGEPGCMIRTGINSGVDIFFGNGFFGKMPPLGADVRVEYLVTDGFSGNMHVENAEDINWEFTETGFDNAGVEVELNDVFDISTSIVPNFGSNAEPGKLTRMLLSKANDRLMIDADYELLFRRMQAFSIIRVGRDKDNDRIFNVMLVPDIKRYITGNINYFNIDTNRFILSSLQKNEILKYIKRMGTETISTDINFVDPVMKKYVINVSLVIFSGYDENVIKNTIVSRISNYFINCSRQDRIPRSDLVKIIEEVDGVDSVNVIFVSKENEDYHMSVGSNPNTLKGLDEINDIIIDKHDLVVIRGGWRDRNGNYYAENYQTDQTLGAINIYIKDINSNVQQKN